jgi:hypothetical protein
MTSVWDDRRSFIRVPFKTDVEIDAGGGIIRSDSKINISMSGLHVPVSGPLPGAETTCRVSIILQPFESRISIEATGEVVRSAPGSLSIHFSELDPESYCHLRQLILNNTDFPEKAEQEFISHWGIKRPSL